MQKHIETDNIVEVYLNGKTQDGEISQREMTDYYGCRNFTDLQTKRWRVSVRSLFVKSTCNNELVGVFVKVPLAGDIPNLMFEMKSAGNDSYIDCLPKGPTEYKIETVYNQLWGPIGLRFEAGMPGKRTPVEVEHLACVLHFKEVIYPNIDKA